MEIKLTSKTGLQLTGKKETVLINPSIEKFEKSSSRIAVYSDSIDVGLLTAGNRVQIAGPGEYEVGGVEVEGYSADGAGTVYSIVIDGVIVAVLGKLKKELSEKRIQRIDGVDVLVVEIGDKESVSDKWLISLAKTWGANYVIPVGCSKGDKELTDFLNITDNEGLQPIERLKVDGDDLPEGMEVVLLKETK